MRQLARSVNLWLAAVTVTFSSIGCGGRTSLYYDDDSELAPPEQQSSDEHPSAGSRSGGDDEGLFQSTALPPCVLGTPRSSASNCDWVFDGLCYATQIDACACACPGEAPDSLCRGGLFPDTFGSVEVRCD